MTLNQVITEPENVDGEQGKTDDSNSRKTMSVSEGGNTEQLEEDNDTNSNSSKEEGDLVGNKSGNPEDIEQANNSEFDSRTVLKDIENPVISKPEQPENCEQLNIAELEQSAEHVPELEEEDIVADNKTNEPVERFVNYFSASHRIPKAIDVMRAKGNIIPLSEIYLCRMYLGINRDTVAVYMSCCKMKYCYKVFHLRKFQSLVVCSTSSLNVDTLDKKLQDINTSVLSPNTLYKPNSAAKLSDTEGKNYLPLPTYF